MPPNQEQRQPGASTTQAQNTRRESPREMQDALVQEVRQVVNNELEKRRLAEKLKQAVTDSSATARELQAAQRTQGERISRPQLEQANTLRRNIVRLLKGVEQGIVEVPSTSNKAVLLNLNEKIGTQLSDTSASYVQPLITKLLESPQSAEDLKSSFDELKGSLGYFSPVIVKEVANSIVEAADAGSLSVTGELARTMFAPELTPEEQNVIADALRAGRAEEEELSEMGSFRRDWTQYYSHLLDEEHIPILQALYSVDKLGELIESTEAEIVEKAREENVSFTDEQIGKKLSEELELKIVLAYSSLFTRVDRSRADKTMEEVMQEGGMFNSIGTIESQFKNALRKMSDKVRQRTELPAGLRGRSFYQRYSIEPLRERDITMESGEKKRMMQYKVIPVPGVEGGVSLADFLTGISSQVDHEITMRSYLHNVQSLFLRQPGENGFWGQLGGYAETIKSEDLDSLLLLPDSDKFITAYRLYVKYLEEEFAKVNWIHQPSMFSSDFFKNDSKVQQRLFKDLQRMYPKLGTEAENWRLRRAMSMGIGIAKGVLLSEAEIAAWADPHVSDDQGTPKFTSVYTNDGAAVEPLNPMWTMWRWQAEGVTKGPLIYLPVQNLDKKMIRRWDHTILWDKLKEYRKAFKDGRIDFKREGREKLFADILPNYGKGGGYFTRGGWRVNEAVEGWKVYDETGNTVDVFKTFKALENIGYDVVRGLTVVKGKAEDKKQLFAYLYQKYIDPNGGDPGQYLQSIKGNDLETKEKNFMNAVYAHMLQQRMPTKFVRISRDRHSEKGESLWKLVRKDLDPNMSGEKFDDLMKELAYVEAAVRNEVSQEMRLYLDDPNHNYDLSGFESTIPYVVDEDAIRRHLPSTHQDEVIGLFNSIKGVIAREKYLDQVAINLNDPTIYPFSLASDEVDLSFIAVRNAGPRVLARTLKDTAQIETIVTKNMKEYLNLLHPISINGKHDFHDLIKPLHHMKETLESIHGHAIATKIAHHMAALTIAYFKKDALAKNIFTKPFAVGRPNSLAAEFAGTWRGVWEWEVADVDNFITELEKERILPKNGPFDLSYQTEDVPDDLLRKRTIFGIPYAKLKHHRHAGTYTGQDLRNNFGANWGDKGKELLNKYLPLFLTAVMYTLISKAAKDATDKK